MTICNTCTLNVLDAHAAFVSDAELAGTVNARLAEENLHYSGRTKISHFLWVLHEQIGAERLRALVTNPLTGLTVAAFLWLPHHPPAGPLWICRFAQQRGDREACGNPGMSSDRLQREN